MSVFRHMVIILLIFLATTTVAQATTATPQQIDTARAKGLAWLISHQQSNGSWQTAGGLEVQSTSQAMNAMMNAGIKSGYVFGKAHAWLANAEALSTESLALQILALNKTGSNTDVLTNRLMSIQHSNGTWGAYKGYFNDFLDTSLAMRVNNNSAALNFAQSEWAFSGGGWPYSKSGPSRLIPTANNIISLSKYNAIPQNTFTNAVIAYGIEWLSANQKADGSFSDDPAAVNGSAYETALASLAFAEARKVLNDVNVDYNRRLIDSGMDKALSHLASNQQSDGSWGGDPLQTAVVLQALPSVSLVDTDKDGTPDVVETHLNTNANKADYYVAPNGCPSGYSFNASLGHCEKPECTSGTTYNSASKLCEANPICSSGVYNATTNWCEANNRYVATLTGGVNYNVPLYLMPSAAYPQIPSSYCASYDMDGFCITYATAPILGYLASTSANGGIPLYLVPGAANPQISGQYCASYDADGSCITYATAQISGYLASTSGTGRIPLYLAPGAIRPQMSSAYCNYSDPDSGYCYTYATAPIIGYFASASGISGGTYTCPSGGTPSGTICNATTAIAANCPNGTLIDGSFSKCITSPTVDVMPVNSTTGYVRGKAIVTPNAGTGGSITPATPQIVNYNATLIFTITPSVGFGIDSVIGCNGVLAGTTYTTGIINDNCNVVAVFKASQTIIFTPPATKTYGDSPFALSATGGGSGNPVTFAVTSGPGTLSGNTLTITGIGDIVITASQAGNANYLAAPDVPRTISISGVHATVSPAEIAADYRGSVALNITNLPTAGDEVLVEQFVDANRNGYIDAGDYVIRSFKVTDGATMSNPNIQKDNDGTANRAISTSLDYQQLNDLYHAPGEYLVRATKGADSSTVSFKVTQVSQVRTITGTVTDGTNPVPGAMLQLTDKWQRPVSYTTADASGYYILNVKQPGDYLLLPMAYGYVAPATPITLAASQNIINQSLVITAGANHVTGLIKDAISGVEIAGVWVQASGNNNSGIAITNISGVFEMWLPSGQYSVTVRSDSTGPGLFAKGYTGFDKQPATVTVSGTTVIPDISLPVGNILVSGHFLDDAGNPVTVAGIPVRAKIRGAVDSREPVSFGVSNASGAYTLGLFSGTNWDISLDDATSQTLGYFGTIRRDFSTTTGPLSGNDLTIYPISAWVQGTVKDSANQLLTGVEVRLRDINSTISATTKSTTDGTYRIGAYAGSWFIDALTENRGTHPVSEQPVTLTNSQTTTIDFVVDVTPPTFTFNPVITPTNVNSQTITGTMEAGAVITVTTDAWVTAGPVSYPTDTTWSCNLSGLQEELSTVTVNATDAAGNPALTPLTQVVRLDTAPPNVIISSPIAGNIANQTPQLLFTVSDGSTVVNVVVKVDGQIVNKVSGSNLDTLSYGLHTILIEATDEVGNSGSATKSFTVIQPLVISSATLPFGITGVFYSQDLSATGGTTPYSWSITTGSLPAGITMNPATGVINGTPSTGGTSSFTVQVTDANLSTATKALTIVVYNPVTVTTASLPSGSVNTPYNHTLTASGGSQPYTWSIVTGNLPSGLTLTPSSGIISGTPVTPGISSFTIQASDSLNVVASKNLSITINSTTPQTISFTPPAAKAYIDPPFDLSPFASGGGSGNPVTFSIVSGPGTISGSTLTITGTGNIVVKASQAGNANYIAAADVTGTIKSSGMGDIITVAGGGIGDNGAATAAIVSNPRGVAVDSVGNLYIADGNYNRIRKVDFTTGKITTVAGNGTSGFAGDNSLATEASLSWPADVAVDSAGNIFIVDTNNRRIRKVSASTGIITTVAGNGGYAYGSDIGDGGPAILASFHHPSGIALDAAGNLYISEPYRNVIRKVNSATGIITTVAGSSNYSVPFCDGCPATSSALNQPGNVAFDSTGNLYIAEMYGGNRIRMVNSVTGIITTVAGNGTPGFSGDGAAATSANLNAPQSVAVDSAGNLYIADSNNGRIRKVDTNGVITTLATQYFPIDAAVDNAGNLYVTEQMGYTLKKFSTTTGAATVVAGNGTDSYFGDGGPASLASFKNPAGVTVDSSGNYYVADTSNQRIRKVNAATGAITTIAGNGSITGTGFPLGDGGLATSATFYSPNGLTTDSAGNVYIADTGNNRIRKINTTGVITTIAGTGSSGYSGDNGAAVSAMLNSPRSVAVDGSGNVFVADFSNHRIRKINGTTGVITTVAGNGTGGYSGDDGAATAASLNSPIGIAIDNAGNIFIADYNNHRIRKVTVATGIITTVAGNSSRGYSGDGGDAVWASLNYPNGVSLDSAGNLFISDGYNSRIRRVDSTNGVITTVAGNGAWGSLGDSGPAIAASFSSSSIAVDRDGGIYLLDSISQRVRKVIGNTAFTDNLESGAAKWESFSGLWHPVTVPSTYALSHSGAASWWYGNDATGTYNNGASNSGALVTVPLNVPSNGQLTFWSWEHAGYYDTRKVYISTNNGNSWTQIFQSFDSSANWRMVTLDLASYSGMSVKLKFEFNVVYATYNYRGWYVDDVKVAAFIAAPPPIPTATENFETGNFSKFPWITSGNGMWTVTTTAKHGGSYAAEAPVSINDSQSAVMEVSKECAAGNMGFWYSVSSEANWDHLIFYVDNVEKGRWSGTVPWTQASFTVTAGTHNFKWVYSKDGSVSTGSDTAWVDDIVFPVPPIGNDDFETGNLTRLPWITSGNGMWTVTTTTKHGGSYAAEAPVSINDFQNAALEVSKDCAAGNMIFWYSVSSEANWDYLIFYVDNVEKGRWSGSVPWTQASFTVTAGTHNFKWVYSKDGSVSTGSDTAWIDDVVFPMLNGP